MRQSKIRTIATGAAITMFFLTLVPMAYWQEINAWFALSIFGLTWGFVFTLGMALFHSDYIEPETVEVEVEKKVFVEVPSDYPIPEHIIAICHALQNGEIDNVTQRQLTEIGISRFKDPPNAATTIDWLTAQGFISPDGSWTGKGRTFFSPAPTELYQTEENGYQRATPATTAPTPATPGG